MRISKEDNLVALINVFETTPEQQQALIDQWACQCDPDEKIRCTI